MQADAAELVVNGPRRARDRFGVGGQSWFRHGNALIDRCLWQMWSRFRRLDVQFCVLTWRNHDRMSLRLGVGARADSKHSMGASVTQSRKDSCVLFGCRAYFTGTVLRKLLPQTGTAPMSPIPPLVLPRGVLRISRTSIGTVDLHSRGGAVAENGDGTGAVVAPGRAGVAVAGPAQTRTAPKAPRPLRRGGAAPATRPLLRKIPEAIPLRCHGPGLWPENRGPPGRLVRCHFPPPQRRSNSNEGKRSEGLKLARPCPERYGARRSRCAESAHRRIGAPGRFGTNRPGFSYMLALRNQHNKGCHGKATQRRRSRAASAHVHHHRTPKSEQGQRRRFGDDGKYTSGTVIHGHVVGQAKDAPKFSAQSARIGEE